MARIVVLDGQAVNPGDNPWDPLALLGELTVYQRTPPEEVLERAQGAAVLVTNKTLLNAATLSALEGILGICVTATGYNIVDTEAARRHAILVCNVPAYSTESVTEHTFALVFELCRRVGLHDSLVHAGEWTKSPDFCFWRTPQRELWQRTMGIIGYGNIGRRVARVGGAFGMKVMATPSRRYPAEPGVVSASVDQLIEEADVLSLHCPLTPETEELICAQRLSRMKRQALLINTARGALIHEADLARALDEGVIAGAALDVLSTEPPLPDNPLLTARNCVITPHVAWTTLEARRRLLDVTVANARGLLSGKPQNVVNAS